MGKKGFAKAGLTIRLLGATIGAIGFYFLAFQRTIIGTALIGFGSLLIAIGATM